MMESEIVEAVARAICKAESFAPDPDSPILLRMREAKAWEARIPMVKAAITAYLLAKTAK